MKERIVALLISIAFAVGCIGSMPVCAMESDPSDNSAEEESTIDITDIIAFGELTDTVSWTLDNAGVLTIFGEGRMPDFLYPSDPEEGYDSLIRVPWWDYSDDISEIVIAEGVTSISSFAFGGCGNCRSVSIPESVEWIGDGAFWCCENLEEINWENGTEYLGDYAFVLCNSLDGITIPESVRHIGSYAFAWCDSLESVTITGPIENSGIYVFAEDPSLENVTIGSGLSVLPRGTFYLCSALAQIIIPEGVEMLDNSAFEECYSLRSIELPESLTSVNKDAFRECTRLNNVVFNGTREQWMQVKFGSGNNSIRTQMIQCWDDNLKLITTSMVTGLQNTYAYTGDAITPEITVKYDSKTLQEGKDYTVEYSDNIDPGTATVSVTGEGSLYWGTVNKKFMITPIATSKVTLTNVASGIKIAWNSVTGAKYYKVYRDDTFLFETSRLYGTDTGVKGNNGTKYTYKVVASLTKDDSGGDSPENRTATGYRLASAGIKSLTNPAPGKMTVKYDKNEYCTGYVIRYGLKSDMSDAKVITVSGAKTVSRTISGLKKGKTYYVQVRTYILEDNKRYYSGFCTTKKLKITK